MYQQSTVSYKDLMVWQRAVDLVECVYKLTKQFPKEEIYGLASQMQRCAVSIPSNIAEGRARGTLKEYLQFLRIAYSSGAELETQIIICKRLPSLQLFDYKQVETNLNEVMRMLNVMIRRMRPTKAKKLEANEAKKLEANEAKKLEANEASI